MGFDDNGTADSTMRGLLAFGTNVVARDNDIQALADIIVYDSVRFTWVAHTGGTDKKKIYWLKDSVKTWVEGVGNGAAGDSLECTGANFKAGNKWLPPAGEVVGAGASYYTGIVLDTFRSVDTTGHQYYIYFGSDTSNLGCDGWIQAMDSISDSAWSFGAGLFITNTTESGTDAWLDIASDDNATAASRPIMYYKFLDIVEVDTTTVVGGWDTRHGNPTRHGAIRH